MILKFFFNFGRFEPCDSYKLYSYKKESVYLTIKKPFLICKDKDWFIFEIVFWQKQRDVIKSQP